MPKQRGGIFRGSRKQRGGIFRGSRKQRGGSRRQRGGVFPFLMPLAAAAIPAIKAAAAATGLGLMGAVGHQVGDSIASRIRGGAGKKKKGVQRSKFVGIVKQQRLGRQKEK